MAKMEAEQAVETAEAAPKRGGGRRLLVIGVIALVLIGLGVGGYFLFARHGAHAPAAKAEAAAEAGPELYLALEPPFVVNFRDDDSMRFLQVGVTLMARDPKALEAAKAADPVIRDALVKLFSAQSFAILSDPAGKQKLQTQALATVRGIVQARYGKPGIEALYFTSFVMQ
ncbi:MAG: flagellar basal body-associated FliL family protein [Fulvimonas sp.]|nr:flagellar basal body-associated FliL family protein [Fulvimonas sp.]